MSGPRRSWSLVVTSEHGGNDVPVAYRELFRGHEDDLGSHRGWDPGTLPLARVLADRFDAPLVSATVTRLLVDLNRSPHNPRVFSFVTRHLPRSERTALLERYHAPHWSSARDRIARGIARSSRLLHLGVHSFTPALDGATRKADVALLYDPARPSERAFAAEWLRALRREAPELVLRRNNPYRGAADGLTTALRKENPERCYLGIELEVSQKHVGPDGRFPKSIVDALARSLDRVLVAGSLDRAAQSTSA